MQSKSRRDFLKKGVYVAPVIVTLNAVPAFAGSGSGYDRHKNRRGRGHREHGNGNGNGHHKDRP